MEGEKWNGKWKMESGVESGLERGERSVESRRVESGWSAESRMEIGWMEWGVENGVGRVESREPELGLPSLEFSYTSAMLLMTASIPGSLRCARGTSITELIAPTFQVPIYYILQTWYVDPLEPA